jgi:uncharacterized protein (TIGR00299 family) protein
MQPEPPQGAKAMTRLILYLDPWTGISGDMLLAALLDTDRGDGRLEARLRSSVAALGLVGTTLEVTRDVEWGVACTRVRVSENGATPLRHLVEMEAIIDAALLSDWVRAQATEAVRRLTAVEAGIHACSSDEICFHEVGAVDTLVDVVGALVLIEALGIEKVMVGPIPVGGGSVEIAHGRIGVPAPATVKLLEGYDIVGGPEMRELTTPTGALLVGQLHAEVGPLPAMRTEKLGYGAGRMKLDHGPNVLRVLIGPATEMIAGGAGLDGDQVIELQSNLDDISSEVIGHTCRLLREAGALDVWTVMAHMKKDRPGVVLHALVVTGDETAAVKTIFEQTGTLGVRRQAVSRHVATRGNVTVKVADKEVKVKWGRWQGRLVSVAPEYEDAAAAVAEGLPLKDVMHQAAEAARALLGSGHLLP